MLPKATLKGVRRFVRSSSRFVSEDNLEATDSSFLKRIKPARRLNFREACQVFMQYDQTT